jgi:4-hydroxy-2-oxoheptanedioate aldolase
VLGHAGFDALIIDHEHSPGGLQTAVHQMRAIRAAGDATILARLPGCDLAAIKRLLDCGAEGLMLPNVESAEEAQSFVSACRYPPGGTRGAHFTVSRAARWGFAADEWQVAAGSIPLIALIESVRGVDAIPEIARVEGLAMLFLGPLDLSASIGKMARWDHPKFRSLMRRAEAAVLASGMRLGGAPLPGESPAECFSRGYGFATAGSDVGMLRQGAIASLQAGAR